MDWWPRESAESVTVPYRELWHWIWLFEMHVQYCRHVAPQLSHGHEALDHFSTTIILAPKKRIKKVMCIIATATDQIRLLAQLMPSASNIGVANIGKTPAKSDFRALLPAIAEAD